MSEGFFWKVLRSVCDCAALYTQRSDRSDSSIAESLYAHGPAKDLAPNKVICTVDFYLLFFVCFVTMGAALALLDNFPQLLRSIAPVAQATEAQAAAGADTAAAAEAAAAAAAATAGGRFWGSISGSASDLLLSESGGGVNGEGGSCGGGGAAGGELAHLGQTLLITFSVCNTLGRIVAGFWSEQALHNHVRPAICVSLVSVVVAGLSVEVRLHEALACIRQQNVLEQDSTMCEIPHHKA